MRGFSIELTTSTEAYLKAARTHGDPGRLTAFFQKMMRGVSMAGQASHARGATRLSPAPLLDIMTRRHAAVFAGRRGMHDLIMHQVSMPDASWAALQVNKSGWWLWEAL